MTSQWQESCHNNIGSKRNKTGWSSSFSNRPLKRELTFSGQCPGGLSLVSVCLMCHQVLTIAALETKLLTRESGETNHIRSRD